MKVFTAAAFSLLVTSASASAAFAQLPGEVRPPRSYDTVDDMRHTFQRWAPSDQVRQIQEAFRDKGFYTGPIDGVLNPEFRRAIWEFQKTHGLPPTARLDAATLAALDLPATGAASPGAPSSFGGEGRPRMNDVEAP